MKSSICSLCAEGLPEERKNMTNEQAEKYLGASGARHFCEKCWPLKVKELRELAAQIVFSNKLSKQVRI